MPALSRARCWPWGSRYEGEIPGPALRKINPRSGTGRRVQSTWPWERNRRLCLQVPRNPESKGAVVGGLPAGFARAWVSGRTRSRAGAQALQAGQHGRGDGGEGRRPAGHRGAGAVSRVRLSGQGGHAATEVLSSEGRWRPCRAAGDKGHVDGGEQKSRRVEGVEAMVRKEAKLRERGRRLC